MSDHKPFAFRVTHRDSESRARLGRLHTPHGEITTPNFIFCATKAAIKGLTIEQMQAVGAEIILSNTYHLMVQPGSETVARLGGLHQMTGWNGPILTDSGGFQIFSLDHGGVAEEIKGSNRPRRASTVKICEEGAEFTSYLDGRKLLLTPEKSMEIQRNLGADLVVQLDECTPFHIDYETTSRAMRRSQRWGERSAKAFAHYNHDHSQALYGVVQGGIYADLRQESAQWLCDQPFFGTAIGGSLGQNQTQMFEVVGNLMPVLPEVRPIHLLGIGKISDILQGVALGIDTFDCVHPTRIARHGWALIKGVPGQRYNLRNARFAADSAPLDESCTCPTCQTYSRGYLHHLFKAQEVLGQTLLTLHNVATMMRLMQDIRHGIANGCLADIRRDWLGK